MPDKCSIIQILRGPKLFNMSIFDWVASLLGAYLAGRFLFNLKTVQEWTLFILFWILLGVFAHKLFKVNTQLGYYLGINPRPIRAPCV